METSADRLHKHREQVFALAAKRGAYNIRVFGSVARGEARPDSDVDLLVDFEAGRSLLDWAGLEIDLEDLLGCEVDIATTKGLKPRVLESVLHDAVPL